jgi:hypothetical protein
MIYLELRDLAARGQRILRSPFQSHGAFTTG